MGGLSIWHWLIVLLVVVLIFGTKKLRNIGQDLGGAVKGFKDGVKGANEEAVDVRGLGLRMAAEVADPVVEVIEEQPTDTARLTAMRQLEIAVAPFLVPGIDVGAERRAQIVCGAVPGNGVLDERIVGRQVETAAEPPRRMVAAGREQAHVHVRGRDVRVARVEDQGHAHRRPRLSGEFGAMRGGARRHLRAFDARETDAGLLEHRAHVCSMAEYRSGSAR